MIRFKLQDENDEYKEYSLNLDFSSSDDYYDWEFDEDHFQAFMEKMECDDENYAGVHDGTGGVDEDGVEWIGYHSYEIKDFPLAISMWKDFFKSQKLLIEA